MGIVFDVLDSPGVLILFAVLFGSGSNGSVRRQLECELHPFIVHELRNMGYLGPS